MQQRGGARLDYAAVQGTVTRRRETVCLLKEANTAKVSEKYLSIARTGKPELDDYSQAKQQRRSRAAPLKSGLCLPWMICFVKTFMEVAAIVLVHWFCCWRYHICIFGGLRLKWLYRSPNLHSILGDGLKPNDPT